MKEKWKDIKDFEGLYQVSNYGRVKSLSRKIKTIKGYTITIKGRILKPTIDNTDYYAVSLWKQNIKVRPHIHRLVAEAFIPNLENKPQVNHIDGDKLNNNVRNLEWCTQQENNIHAYNHGLNPSRKKVDQYDLNGNYIKTWNSIHDANIFYNSTHISDCCRGIRNQTKGYIWKYTK